MSKEYNIYCDESCHLQRHDEKVMVLGALTCSRERRLEISRHIRKIKADHGFSSFFEIKMNKVSPSKTSFYLDLLDYFFKNDDLSFRAVVIPDKTILRHEDFNQNHDGFYYKILFNLLNVLLVPRNSYRIFIDRKDTRSGEKARQLHHVLRNNAYDFRRNIIQFVQPVLSHESDLLQICDLLTGIIAYANRGLTDNAAKVALVERMKDQSDYSLDKTTLLREYKTNIFVWRAQKEAA